MHFRLFPDVTQREILDFALNMISSRAICHDGDSGGLDA